VTASANLSGISGDRPARFALSDYDNDGAIDLATGTSPDSVGSAVMLWHNQIGGQNFLKVRLTGNKIKNAIGSKISLYQGGHLGDVRVRFWPDNTQVDVVGVAPGSRVRIGEDGTHTSY
jgi:hypothetical protein